MEVKTEQSSLPDNEQENLPNVNNVVRKTLNPKQFVQKLYQSVYGKDYAKSSNKVNTDLFQTPMENKAFKIFLQASWAEHKSQHPNLEINLREFMSLAQSKWLAFDEKGKKTFFEKVRRKPLPGVPMFARKMVSRSKPPNDNSAGLESSVDLNKASIDPSGDKIDSKSKPSNDNSAGMESSVDLKASIDPSSDKIDYIMEIQAYKKFQQVSWAEHKSKHPNSVINLSEFMVLAQSKWQEFGEKEKKAFLENPTNNSTEMESSIEHNKPSGDLGSDKIDDLPRKRKHCPKKKQNFRQMIPNSDSEINKSIDIVTRLGDSDFELNKSIDLVIGKMFSLSSVTKPDSPSKEIIPNSEMFLTPDPKPDLPPNVMVSIPEKILPPVTKRNLQSKETVPRSIKKFKPPQFIKKEANENDMNSLNVSMNSLPSKTFD